MSGKDPLFALQTGLTCHGANLILAQVSAGSRCTLVIVKPDPSPSSSTLSVNKVYQFGYGSCMPIRVDFRPAEASQAHKSFWGIGCRDSTAGRINIRQVSLHLGQLLSL